MTLNKTLFLLLILSQNIFAMDIVKVKLSEKAINELKHGGYLEFNIVDKDIYSHLKFTSPKRHFILDKEITEFQFSVYEDTSSYGDMPTSYMEFEAGNSVMQEHMKINYYRIIDTHTSIEIVNNCLRKAQVSSNSNNIFIKDNVVKYEPIMPPYSINQINFDDLFDCDENLTSTGGEIIFTLKSLENLAAANQSSIM